ncbi:hypothetical protein VI817_002646 [Penicillium citrinum]|nr:hypothetical protein VI817_002646 [Penicillium citrinum]
MEGLARTPTDSWDQKSVRHSTKPVTAESEQHHGDSAGAASGDPASNGGSTSQSQDTEVYQPTVNSFEQTTSVLPSVEPNEIDGAEISGDADNCELQSVFPQNSPTGLLFSQPSPVGFGPARKFCRSPCYGVTFPRSLSPPGPLHVPSTSEKLVSSQLRPRLTNFGESFSDWMNSDSVITPESPAMKSHSLQLEPCLSEPDDRLTQEELIWCMTEPVRPEPPRTGFPYIPPGGSMPRPESPLREGETQWERDNRELERIFLKDVERRDLTRKKHENMASELKRKRQEELDLAEENERSCRRRIAKDLRVTFDRLYRSETSDERKDRFYDAKDSSPELETRSSEFETRLDDVESSEDLRARVYDSEHSSPELESRSSELETRLGDTEMSEGVENRLNDPECLSLELETRSSELETRSNESDVCSSHSKPFSSGPAASVGEPETTSYGTTIPFKRPGLLRRIASFTRRFTRYPKFRSVPSSLRAPRWTSTSPHSPCDGYEIRYSNLDNLLMNAPSQTDVKWAPLGPQRKFPKAKAYDILSPSNSPSSLNRVEKSIKTTPIRRTRLSYAAISRRRRSEASGRIDRTLYRLPELLSQNEADGGVSDSTNLTTRPPPQASTPMTNPGAASLHLTHDDALVTGSPSKPGNAPTEVNASAERSHQAESPSSPGFVKWAFNQVSRRWTNIRDRYAGSTPTTAESPGT